MSKLLRYTLYGIGLALVLFVLSYLIDNWKNSETFSISYKYVGSLLFVFLIGFLSKFLAKIINIEAIVKKKAFMVMLITFGCLLSNIYIWFFNSSYNRMGRVKK